MDRSHPDVIAGGLIQVLDEPAQVGIDLIDGQTHVDAAARNLSVRRSRPPSSSFARSDPPARSHCRRGRWRKSAGFSYCRDVLNTIGQSAPGKVFGPLTGSTSSTMRQQIVDDFTDYRGPAVLVDQIEAGGLGLNVQAASVVVIAEPQWKPSTEEQAIARAHCMGQLRTVQVHRLLARNSNDESIRKLLHSKTELFNSYARPSHAKDRDLESVAAGRVGDLREEDLIAIEQRRLGVA